MTAAVIKRPEIQTGDGNHGTWVTPDRAAELTQVSPRTIRRWIGEDRVQVYCGYLRLSQVLAVEAERRAARNPGRPGPRHAA